MSTIELQIPEDLKDYIADRMRSEGFATVNDCIVDLLKRQQDVARQERLFAVIKDRLADLDRGAGGPMTTEDWAETREQVRANV